MVDVMLKNGGDLPSARVHAVELSRWYDFSASLRNI